MTWEEIIMYLILTVFVITISVIIATIVCRKLISSNNKERIYTDETLNEVFENHKENIETLTVRVSTLENNMNEYKRKCDALEYRLQKLEPTCTIGTIGSAEVIRAPNDISIENCFVKTGTEVIKDEIKELKEVVKNLAKKKENPIC